MDVPPPAGDDAGGIPPGRTDPAPRFGIGKGRAAVVLHLIVIVKPFRVEAVLEAVAPVAAAPPSVQEVRGYGRQKGHLDAYSGGEFGLDFVPKARIELEVEDLFLDEAIDAIVRAARTGRIGDGKIFVLRPLDPGAFSAV